MGQGGSGCFVWEGEPDPLLPLRDPPDGLLFHFLICSPPALELLSPRPSSGHCCDFRQPRSTPERPIQRVPLALDPAADAPLIRRCAARHSRSSPTTAPGGSMINN